MRRRDFFRAFAAIGLSPAVTLPLAGRPPSAPRTRDLWPAPTSAHYWRWIRQQFAVPLDEAYFNVGTYGARPRQVTDAVVDHLREIDRTIAHYDYRPEHAEYFAGYRKQEELRAKVGSLINATALEVALLQNATMGSNLIAHGLDLQSGDEVLMTDQEHPGACGAWELREKRQGIHLRKLPIGAPPADPGAVVRVFADAIGPRTRVIAIPHITSKLGIVLPVREICELARQRSIFTLIDGAQALGQLPLDVKAIGCDAYTTSAHKWLLAPAGNGVLYVREERMRDVWATLASGNWNDYQPADGIFRLMQFGTASLALLIGFDAAIDFYKKIGADRVEQRVLELSNRLRAGLRQIQRATIYSPSHPSMACGIVAWGIDGVTGPQLMDELWNRRKIRVRSQDDKMVRQSAHFYNRAEEIDATLATARDLALRQ
jgi:isopenicillin-N epimerase